MGLFMTDDQFMIQVLNSLTNKDNGNGTRNGVAGTVTDIVLSSIESKEEGDHEIWIGDSGALCHY
jgi:hypothetical protein